jgi:hypothetical protein
MILVLLCTRIKSIVLCHWIALMLASTSLLPLYGVVNARFKFASLCLAQSCSRVQAYSGFNVTSVSFWRKFAFTLCGACHLRWRTAYV